MEPLLLLLVTIIIFRNERQFNPKLTHFLLLKNKLIQVYVKLGHKSESI